MDSLSSPTTFDQLELGFFRCGRGQNFCAHLVATTGFLIAGRTTT
jgi:hypothetical protein